MSRLGSKQAGLLFQLSCGYVRASADDPYKALRAKGYVHDSDEYERGSLTYRRKSGQKEPTVTRDGMDALRAYVDRHGPLEIELMPIGAHFTQVFRMTPTDKPAAETVT